VPDISFYITGSKEKIPPALKDNAPPNVIWTGFISGSPYYAFLRAMDTVIVLTDREESALLGAYESISAETPLVVSDTSTMRYYFPSGTLFADNNAPSISRALGEALRRIRDLEAGIKKLKQQKLKRQAETFRKIAEQSCQSP
jgi:glycosyltransferase involved in cell wall biosynthesis